MPERTDAETVASFMEARPDLPPHWGAWPEHQWWLLIPTAGGRMDWTPKELNLDALYLVEARLTDEQWERYVRLLLQPVIQLSDPRVHWKKVLHATTADKIVALVAVIREAANG